MKIFRKFFLLLSLPIFIGCSESFQNEGVRTQDECLNCNDVFLDPGYNHFYTTDRTVGFTGKCKSYFEDGSVREEKVFEDGKQTGVYKEFYPNGNLKSEWEFRKGRQHGNIKGYDENENLLYHQIFYKGDFKESVFP